jgi:uncharacterized protein
MALPQRLTFVTLGAYSVARLRDFYRSWGWTVDDGEPDDASFIAGSVRLALDPMDRLRDGAAPGADLPAEGSWGGVTLAITFASRPEVDTAVAAAAAAGAQVVHPPVDRDWGGYSGYVADPEGHRWELAWAPGITPD